MDSLKHGTNEQLELYSLGRLEPAEAESLEDHFMICSNCQERFEQVEAFALGMRDALWKTPASEKTAPKSLAASWSEFASGWLRKPSFAVAMGMVAILLVTILFSRTGTRALQPVAAIQLSAMRGEMATVQAARELDITLADAPKTAGPYRVEIVNGTGHSIWKGMAPVTNAGLEVKAQVNQIEPGNYFIRLYGADGELMHEYGLRVTQ